MKTLLKSIICRFNLAICLIVLFSNCSRDNNTPTSSSTMFSFKVNGIKYSSNSPYTFNGEPSINRDIQNGVTLYFFECYNLPNSNGTNGTNTFNIYLITNTLSQTTYTGTYDLHTGSKTGNAILNSLSLPETSCSISSSSLRSLTMTFTRISNGTADGTFSGSLNIGGSCGVVNITDGQFKNVKVVN